MAFLNTNAGLMARIFVVTKNLNYENLVSYSEHMYHVERGHCGGFSYKMHSLALGKTFNDGLMFIHDEATMYKMEHATVVGLWEEIYVGERAISKQVRQLDNTLDKLPVLVDETYSNHKGTKFALINVEVVDTEKVDEMFIT